MAQEAVNAVVQAFQRGMEQVQARNARQEELKLQQQREDAEERYRQQQLDQQQKQFDAQQKANEALFNLHRSAQEYTQAGQAQQTGQTPPGWQTLPGVQPTPDQPLVLSGLQNTQYIPPSGQTISSPPLSQSPAVLLAQQKAREAEATRIRETQVTQNAEFNKQLALDAQRHQDTLEILGRQQDFQSNQTDKELAARKDELNSRNSLQLQLMGLKTGQAGVWGSTVTTGDDGEMKVVPNDPTQRIGQAVDMVRDGTLSIEQAKKLYNTKQFPVIADAVSRAGLIFPTDKQIQKLTEIEPVAGLVDKLYQIHKLRLDHPFALQFPMSDATSQFNTLKDQIGGSVGGAAKFLNNIPRFSNVEKEQVTKALIPSTDVISHTGSEEFKKYETFTKDVQDAFNTILNTVPENQRNIIRQRMGLNNFPYLGSAIRTPGASTPAIGGANPPGVNIPNTTGQPKPGQIYVRKKSTGQEGWLDPGDFNDARYEKAKPPGVK